MQYGPYSKATISNDPN